MSDYRPAVGDRVSVAGVVRAVSPSGMGVTVDLDGVGIHFGSNKPDGTSDWLTLLGRPSPSEHWQLGDVVRNADDPDDGRTWWCWKDRASVDRWHEIGTGDWSSRHDLPANLALLIRDGRPVAQPNLRPMNERILTFRNLVHAATGVAPDPLDLRAAIETGVTTPEGYALWDARGAERHPQPGDVITEEPPVGSVVRNPYGAEFANVANGWRGQSGSYSWVEISGNGATLTLVRWGAEQ